MLIFFLIYLLTNLSLRPEAFLYDGIGFAIMYQNEDDSWKHKRLACMMNRYAEQQSGMAPISQSCRKYTKKKLK